jgi:hypothetical protein
VSECYDAFARREAAEAALWDRYPQAMAALAPGDLPAGATREQRDVYRWWQERYRRVLRGELSPSAALALDADTRGVS